MKKLQPNRSAIYFITDGENIKIGFAFYPQYRIKEIQTCNAKKLELLFKYHPRSVTARSEEIKLHKKFKDIKVRGEWFKDEGTIKAYIEEIRGTVCQNITGALEL